VPEPLTIYRNVRALEPGTSLKIDRGGRRQTASFESVAGLLTTGADAGGPSAQTLRDALLDTVRHHLIADVPVGVFLSAGIDSTTLAALAAECGSNLRTVTLGFEEYRGTDADETVLAEKVARQYGAHHQTVWIGRRDFEDIFESFMYAMDQPSIDGLNSWLVSRAAAQLGLKVALTGLGGDELFGGYPSFTQVPQLRRWTQPFGALPGLGKVMRKLAAPVARHVTNEKYAGLLEYGPTWEGSYLLRRALRMPWEVEAGAPVGPSLPAAFKRGEPSPKDRSIVSWLEMSYYMRNQLLRDSDWAGMAHSIELRVPLVDVELTRFVAAALASGRQYGKKDFARVAEPALPGEIVHRPKTGFTVPVRDWIRTGDRGADSRERGLRGWQRTVLHNYMQARE